MNIEYLIQLLENKMIVLTNTKAQAFMVGDLALINSIEIEMAGVTDTLYKLRLLLNASQQVGLINNNLVELMKIAPKVITDGSTDCLNYYDISSYATDPLHEQKIADILSAMGSMDNTGVVDAYIEGEAIGSPVTGIMILNAADEYSVDARLMMALMELDSRFGTAGVAVDTLNPGNVGNDGTNTKTYPSWEAGVNAVAKWLDKHRIIVEPVAEPVVPPEEVPSEEVTPIPEEPVVPPEEVPSEEVTPIPEEPVVPPEEVPPEEIPAPELTPEPTPEPAPTVSSTKRKRRMV